MDHVAIMKKSWHLIPKILNGRKKIESRWGKNRVAPWGRVKKGDRVYFKNSGENVIARAIVTNVMEFENLTPLAVKDILDEYGSDDGISVSSLEDTYEWAKNKRYCTLIYLEDPESVDSFGINKRGFGTGAAWITVPSIKDIKI